MVKYKNRFENHNPLSSFNQKLRPIRNCPIWGKQDGYSTYRIDDTTREVSHFWSPRAGGAFSLTQEACDSLADQTTKFSPKKLSKWIFQQNSKNTLPKLTTNDISPICSTPSLTVTEQLNALLAAYADIPETPAHGINLSYYDSEEEYIVYGVENTREYRTYHDETLLAQAATETEYIELHWLNSALVLKGNLKELSSNSWCITPEGLVALERNAQNSHSDQAFVAMWFNQHMDTAYNTAISKAVTDAGYRPYRGDFDKSHSDQITNNLIAQIKQSKFLIADFTHGEDGARGSVYFEAGFALGLGLPVLWLIKKDGTSEKHFDTNQYPHIIWETEEQLYKELKDTILAHQHIGKGPL